MQKETVRVGFGDEAQERGLTRPRGQHYLNLLKLVRGWLKDDYAEAFERFADPDVPYIDNIIDVIDALEEEHLERLGAALLQFEDLDEGVEFIRERGGVDPLWLSEAFAVNMELAEIERVKENFRRGVRFFRADDSE